MHSEGVVVSMAWAMDWVPVQVKQHGKSMACIKIPVADWMWSCSGGGDERRCGWL